MTIEENFNPSPVSVTMPTMMPAAAQVVAALSTPIEPSAIAAVSFFDDGTASWPAGVRPIIASTAITAKISSGNQDVNADAKAEDPIDGIMNNPAAMKPITNRGSSSLRGPSVVSGV